MRNDREPGQRRGMEFLKHHPVADDVLDIVGHHRNRKGDELRAEARVAHRSERSLRRRRCGVFGLDVQGSTLRGGGGRRLRNPVKVVGVAPISQAANRRSCGAPMHDCFVYSYLILRGRM